MEQLQKTERTEAKERKDLIDASPIFPGWRQEGGGTGGRKEKGVMWHYSLGVATVQKEADLQKRWPLTSKAAERVLGGSSTTQSITSQSLVVSRTVGGHHSRTSRPTPKHSFAGYFFWPWVRGVQKLKLNWSRFSCKEYTQSNLILVKFLLHSFCPH